MAFTAAVEDGSTAAVETYFSIGGGFVVTEHGDGGGDDAFAPSLAYCSSQAMLEICRTHELSIDGVALRNEMSRVPRRRSAANSSTSVT